MKLVLQVAPACAASPRQRLVDSKLLTGIEFTRFCRLRGLCQLCGLNQTHTARRRFATKPCMEPLTTRQPNGDYLVYKGYCIQPTCYTLEQAKRLLGERLDEEITDELPEPRKEDVPEPGKRRKSGFSLRSILPDRTRKQANPSASGSPSIANAQVSRPGAKVLLDLSNQELTFEHIENLVYSQLDEIKTLVLDHCDLGDAGVSVLVDALIWKPPPRLKVLCLRRNEIGPDGCKALARLMESTSTLTTVRLSHNNFGDDGAKIIFRRLQYLEQSSISELSLTSNGISHREAVTICTALMENRNLTRLSLDHNYLGDEGVRQICHGLSENANTRLTTLSLQHNFIGDSGAVALARMLGKRRGIEVLLKGNDIGNDGAASLLSGMTISPHQLSCVEGLELNQVTDLFLLDQITRLNKQSQANREEEDLNRKQRDQDTCREVAKQIAPAFRHESAPMLGQQICDEHPHATPRRNSSRVRRLDRNGDSDDVWGSSGFQQPSANFLSPDSTRPSFSCSSDVESSATFSAHSTNAFLPESTLFRSPASMTCSASASVAAISQPTAGTFTPPSLPVFDHRVAQNPNLLPLLPRLENLGPEITNELIEIFPNPEDLVSFLSQDESHPQRRCDDTTNYPGAYPQTPCSGGIDIPNLAAYRELEKLFDNSKDLQEFLNEGPSLEEQFHSSRDLEAFFD